jgi:hypothetical protein
MECLFFQWQQVSLVVEVHTPSTPEKLLHPLRIVLSASLNAISLSPMYFVDVNIDHRCITVSFSRLSKT